MKHSRRTFFKQGLAGAPFIRYLHDRPGRFAGPCKAKSPEGRKPVPSGNGGIYFR